MIQLTKHILNINTMHFEPRFYLYESFDHISMLGCILKLLPYIGVKGYCLGK